MSYIVTLWDHNRKNIVAERTAMSKVEALILYRDAVAILESWGKLWGCTAHDVGHVTAMGPDLLQGKVLAVGQQPRGQSWEREYLRQNGANYGGSGYNGAFGW